MSGRTPSHRLREDVRVKIGEQDYKELPRGSIVKAVHHDYVPKDHAIRSGWDFRRMQPVYSKFGLVLVDPKQLEEVY